MPCNPAFPKRTAPAEGGKELAIADFLFISPYISFCIAALVIVDPAPEYTRPSHVEARQTEIPVVTPDTRALFLASAKDSPFEISVMKVKFAIKLPDTPPVIKDWTNNPSGSIQFTGLFPA